MSKQAHVLGVIPSRLRSTRLPNKALREIEGVTLLERVYRQAKLAKRVGRLVVATDSQEIQSLAQSFGAQVLMTDPSISNGSERVAVAASMLGERFDAVVNIQGDMPFIRPEIIDDCVDFYLTRQSDFEMATVATPISSEEIFLSQSDVKVVLGQNERALYFSRAPIPHSRDGQRPHCLGSNQTVFGFKHLGLYVFGERALEEYARRESSELEAIECLEQLRLLAKGYRIGVRLIAPELTAGSVEVDTEGDLRKAQKIAQA